MSDRDRDVVVDYSTLLHDLWTTGKRNEGADPWAMAQLCEVAFFEQGFVQSWYFSDKRGILRRKRRLNMSCNALFDALSEGVPNSVAGSQQVLAQAVLQQHGAAFPTVVSLNRAQLEWLLDKGSVRRREALRAVLRYEPPRSEREAVLRMDWRAQLCSVEMKSSRTPLRASKVPINHRLATHGPALAHSQVEKHVPPAFATEAAKVAEALLARLQPRAEREALRICIDLKVSRNNQPDGSPQLVMLWFALPPADAAFPAEAFPSSMPAVMFSIPEQQPHLVGLDDDEEDEEESWPQPPVRPGSSPRAESTALARLSRVTTPREGHALTQSTGPGLLPRELPPGLQTVHCG